MDDEVDWNFRIHIRVEASKKGGGRKKLMTVVEGLPEEFDYKKILKYWKKNFNCGGSVLQSEEDEE
jgi:translation initiation factor 1